MAKEKKISIKYYLNKKLKPDEKGQFPLYVQVGYKCNNIQFKFISFELEEHIYLSEQHFDDMLEGKLNRRIDIDYFENLVTECIRHEEFIYNYENSITGLSRRLRHYHTSKKLTSKVEGSRFHDSVLDVKTQRQDKKVVSIKISYQYQGMEVSIVCPSTNGTFKYGKEGISEGRRFREVVTDVCKVILYL